jgi:hypothetical protein
LKVLRYCRDGIDLGSSSAPSLTRKGLDSEDKVHWLFPMKKSDCIFEIHVCLAFQVSFSLLTNRFENSEDLKISSEKYRALCEAANLEMDFPNAWDLPTDVEKVTYTDCLTKAPEPGYCQCKH